MYIQTEYTWYILLQNISRPTGLELIWDVFQKKFRGVDDKINIKEWTGMRYDDLVRLAQDRENHDSPHSRRRHFRMMIICDFSHFGLYIVY